MLVELRRLVANAVQLGQDLILICARVDQEEKLLHRVDAALQGSLEGRILLGQENDEAGTNGARSFLQELSNVIKRAAKAGGDEISLRKG